MARGGKRPGAGRKPRDTRPADDWVQDAADRAEGRTPEPQRGRGQPSLYQATFAKQAEKLCSLGATDEDLADFFEVSVRTISRWKTQHEDFCQSLRDGKAGADDRVERSLYQKAVGYTHDAVKIMQHQGEVIRAEYREHFAPDTTACIFWLKNRRPDLWRDKQIVEHDGKVQVGADAAFGDLVGALEAAARLKSGGLGGESEMDRPGEASTDRPSRH